MKGGWLCQHDEARNGAGLFVSFRLLTQSITATAVFSRIGATPLHSRADLLPLLRILGLAAIAGIALKLTSATLGAIEDLPRVAGLLELIGLVSLLNLLSRNASRQQKRAELLVRIEKLRHALIS